MPEENAARSGLKGLLASPRIYGAVAAALMAWVAVRTCMLLADAWPFNTDDAYITLRYARHWVEGHGISWNIGEPRVEGYSNFLFLVIGDDAIKVIFNGIADYLKLSNKGNFILPFCTIPDAIGEKGVKLAGNLFKAIAV